MALQIWLPLLEDAHNQGLMDIEPTVMGTGITYTAGKLGNSATFPCSAASCIHIPGLQQQGSFSWACWFKCVGKGDGSYPQYILSEGRDTGRTGINISLNNPGELLFASDHNSSISTSVELNEWHHVAFVLTDTIKKLYVDGRFILSTPASAEHDYTQSNDRFVIGKMAYSYSNTSNYFPFNGQICDVRIYDHALSVKEIKEISKGLIAHYPLNDKIGGENLIPHSRPSASNLSLIGVNTHYVSFVIEDGRDCYQCGTGNTTPSSMSITWQYTVLLDANTTYTYSALIKSNKSVNFNFTNLGHFQVYNSASTASDKTHEDIVAQRIYYPSKVAAGEWTRISLTFTTNSLAESSFRVYPTYNCGSDCIVYICDQKLEKGSIATPWIPNKSDDEYSELGLDDDTIYDASGYGHNLTSTAGTVADIEAESNSPRYSIGTRFNKVSKHGASVFIGKSFSISLWLKLNAFHSSWGRYIDLYYSSKEYIGICDGNTAEKIGAHIYKDVDGTSVVIRDGYTSGWTTGEWFHVVVVVDGTSFILYRNGMVYDSEEMTYENSELVREIYLDAAKDNSSSGDHSLSDVRIYATALSAEDVKELYETSVSIDQNGNTWAYELVEDGYDDDNVVMNLNNNIVKASGIGSVRYSDNEVLFTGYTWGSTAAGYVEIDPTKYKYRYRVDYTVSANNRFYLGFERYDTDKTATSNASCIYPINVKPTTQTHYYNEGYVDLTKDVTGNACKFIKLRILNAWENSSDTTSVAAIYSFVLKREPI